MFGAFHKNCLSSTISERAEEESVSIKTAPAMSVGLAFSVHADSVIHPIRKREHRQTGKLQSSSLL